MNLHEFLEKFPCPGKILFAKVWGSCSHNLQKEGSDTDFSGIFYFPTSQLLAVRHPHEPGLPETWKHDKEKEGVSKEDHPDHEFHEVGKFCDLLLKGNPGIIEMLFTDRMIITTPAWEELRVIRNNFLCQESVRQYIGYMQNQLRRLIAHDGQRGLHTKGGNYNEKWAYHILRLAEDAKRIAVGSPPQVWKEGEERDFLMRVRHNEFSWQEVNGMILMAIQKTLNTDEPMPPFENKKGCQEWLDKGLEALPIPKYGNKDALNSWLLKFRKENW